MTQHPDKNLKPSDIPQAVHGAALYIVEAARTGGHNVIMIEMDGHRSVVEHKSSDQAALRIAVRLQKRENAAVAASRKAGGR